MQEEIFAEAIAPNVAESPKSGSIEILHDSPIPKAPELEILQPEILDIRKPNQRKIGIKQTAPSEVTNLEIKDAEVIAVDKSHIKNLKTSPAPSDSQFQDND